MTEPIPVVVITDKGPIRIVAKVTSIGDPIPVVPVDRSGVIAGAGVSQPFLPADAKRKGFWIRNYDLVYDLWISDLGGVAIAAAPCLRIPADSYYESPAGASVLAHSILSLNAGVVFAARSWPT